MYQTVSMFPETVVLHLVFVFHCAMRKEKPFFVGFFPPRVVLLKLLNTVVV